MPQTFEIGHYTDLINITGCTVILCPPHTAASCHICGSSPGSRELALLAPDKKMAEIHALFLTGGSAFGLNATAGVMQYLSEKEIGYPTPFALVPIVPAAVIYDLNIGTSQFRVGPEHAYQACQAARADFSAQGSIGAATGATVGKWTGLKSAMKGGLGIKKITLDKAWIMAISVVNSVGDIIDGHGQIVAGAIDTDFTFRAGTSRLRLQSASESRWGENTVLCALLTNIKLNKLQAYLLAQRGQNGLARAITPAGTSYDGDIIFCLSHGSIELNMDLAVEMANEAIRLSIIESARQAQSLGGFLSCSDLEKHRNRK